MRIQAQIPPARVARHGLSLEPSRQRLLTPEGEALRFPTDGSSFFLGSDDKSLIQRQEAQPQQAEARWRDGTLWVRGQNTLANGQPCRDWTPLGDGGHIQLAGMLPTGGQQWPLGSENVAPMAFEAVDLVELIVLTHCVAC